MKRISKSTRKRYNEIADRHTEQEASVSKSLNIAMILIVNLGLAYGSIKIFPAPYGGYGAWFFIGVSILFIIGFTFSNNDHIEIK
jgi:hypothetical protein